MKKILIFLIIFIVVLTALTVFLAVFLNEDEETESSSSQEEIVDKAEDNTAKIQWEMANEGADNYTLKQIYYSKSNGSPNGISAQTLIVKNIGDFHCYCSVNEEMPIADDPEYEFNYCRDMNEGGLEYKVKCRRFNMPCVKIEDGAKKIEVVAEAPNGEKVVYWATVGLPEAEAKVPFEDVVYDSGEGAYVYYLYDADCTYKYYVYIENGRIVKRITFIVKDEDKCDVKKLTPVALGSGVCTSILHTYYDYGTTVDTHKHFDNGNKNLLMITKVSVDVEDLFNNEEE